MEWGLAISFAKILESLAYEEAMIVILVFSYYSESDQTFPPNSPVHH